MLDSRFGARLSNVNIYGVVFNFKCESTYFVLAYALRLFEPLGERRSASQAFR